MLVCRSHKKGIQLQISIMFELVFCFLSQANKEKGVKMILSGNTASDCNGGQGRDRALFSLLYELMSYV